MKKYLILLSLILITTLSFGQRTLTREKVTTDTLASSDSTIIKVIGDLVPLEDTSYDLGTESLKWKTGHFDTVNTSIINAINLDWISPFPDSFSYRPPFHVLQNPNTDEYLIDPAFNLRDYAAIEGTGTAYYVNVETGSDANPGTSAGSPLKSISAALAKTDVGTIYVASGYYYNQYSWKGAIPTRSIEIIGTGDSAILTSDFRDVLTFTAEGNLYKAFTDTTPSVLWDRLATDQFGDPLTLAVYSSKAEVDTATTGAYYYATDTIFVRLPDFREPDSFMSVFTPNFNVRLVGEGLKYYFKNIYLYGGGISTTNTDGSNGGVRVYVDSMTARGGDFTFDGNQEVILFNSSFAKVRNADLLNYDPQNGVIPDFVEYNCTVYNTMDRGYTPGGSDQASTAHNGCRGLRINSTYKYTVGQCMADVNGCESWLVGCEADSAITASSANYFFGTGSDFGRAWLQDCESYNRPPSGFDINSTVNQVVHINNFISDNYDFGTSGEIDSNYTSQLYTPLEFQMVRTMINTLLMNLTTVGTTGQTIRFNGSIPVANSFLTNTGTGIGIGTPTPSGELHVFSNTSNVTATIGTGVGGVSTSLVLTNTLGDWNAGCQNTINSGAFILSTTALASSSAQYTFGRNGNAAFGTTDIATYKLNLGGTLRIGTTALSTNKTDSVAVLVGSTQAVGKVARGVFMQNSDSVSNANITMVVTTPHYSFDGSTATWTLPTLAASDGYTYFIMNRGSGNLTINTSGGGNEIYDTVATNTFVISAGASIMIHNDGTYFTIQD